MSKKFGNECFKTSKFIDISVVGEILVASHILSVILNVLKEAFIISYSVNQAEFSCYNMLMRQVVNNDVILKST